MTTVLQKIQNTVFHELSDVEIDHYEEEYTEKYAGFIRDTSLTNNERHLKYLVQELAEPQNREWELYVMQQIPIRKLLPQLKEISNEIYLAMVKTGNWGPMLHERVSLSHCRHILNIPAHLQVTWLDITRLDLIINRLDKKLGYMTGGELVQYCIDKTVSLFGKDYTSFQELTDFIENLDADYYFYSDTGPLSCGEFIFGEVIWTEIGDQKIYTFVNEFSRSPSHILGLVGRSGNLMQIRYQALEQIHQNKWVLPFEEKPFQCADCKKNPNGFIHDVLANIAMKKNGLLSYEAALQTKHLMLDRMKDGVIYHEMGHNIIREILGPVHYSTYNAFTEENNILHSLGEALADWAPRSADKQGSFMRWVDIAETDNISAQACWLYPSDNWFVDGDEDSDIEFLSLRSDILVSIFFYVNKDANINFSKVKSEQPRIFELLKDTFLLVTDKLMSLIYSAQYVKEGKKCSYEDIEPEFLQKFKKTSRDELQQVFGFWRDIRKEYFMPNEKLWKQVQDILETESKIFQKTLLDMINEQNNKHYSSLRDFIIAKCKQIQKECIV